LINADWGGGKILHNQKVRLLKGNVEFYQGDAFLKCDSCIQYPDSRKFDLYGHVEIFNNNKWLYADHVTYFEDPNVEIADGNVKLVDSTKTFYSSRLKYIEEKEVIFADDSVKMVDSTNDLTLTGDHCEYHRTNGFAKVTGFPFLTKKDSLEQVELTIEGRLMEMHGDGERVVVKDSVIINRGAIVAQCGQLQYLKSGEEIILSDEPEAKRKFDNIWGNEIILFLAENKVYSIRVKGKSLVKTKVDTLNFVDTRFNYISGEQIDAWISNEVMDSVLVTGQATSYYYVIEDGQDKGINKVLGDKLFLEFEKSELAKVRVNSSPGTTTGTFCPSSHSYLLEKELTDFSASQ